MSISDFEVLASPLEEEEDSRGCYYVTKKFLFGAISFLLPGLCLYVGTSYHYCEDESADWLIAGGILAYGDLSLYLVRRILKRFNIDCDKRDCLLGLIFIVSAALFIWWVWGFSRIFSGTMNDNPVMEDPVCKEYLYWFPFWLTISPFIIIFGWMLGALCYAILCYPIIYATLL